MPIWNEIPFFSRLSHQFLIMEEDNCLEHWKCISYWHSWAPEEKTSLQLVMLTSVLCSLPILVTLFAWRTCFDNLKTYFVFGVFICCLFLTCVKYSESLYFVAIFWAEVNGFLFLIFFIQFTWVLLVTLFCILCWQVGRQWKSVKWWCFY